MKTNFKSIFAFTVLLLLIITSSGCNAKSKENKSNETDKTYSVEQFADDMKSRNYKFEIEDTKDSEIIFKSAERKKLVLDSDTESDYPILILFI